jgi:hypothetical protein
VSVGLGELVDGRACALSTFGMAFTVAERLVLLADSGTLRRLDIFGASTTGHGAYLPVD